MTKTTLGWVRYARSKDMRDLFFYDMHAKRPCLSEGGNVVLIQDGCRAFTLKLLKMRV